MQQSFQRTKILYEFTLISLTLSVYFYRVIFMRILIILYNLKLFLPTDSKMTRQNPTKVLNGLEYNVHMRQLQ